MQHQEKKRIQSTQVFEEASSEENPVEIVNKHYYLRFQIRCNILDIRPVASRAKLKFLM